VVLAGTVTNLARDDKSLYAVQTHIRDGRMSGLLDIGNPDMLARYSIFELG